jgi:4'-phosphopantetheinyl transferase
MDYHMNQSGILWRFPPSHLELPHNEIHLWCAPLTNSKQSLDQITSILSPDEQDRASKFIYSDDRRKFMIGRYILRNILAFYTEKDPRDVEIHYTPLNKPFLPESYEQNIQFNLSHSEDLMAVAIARDVAVGIDIESTSYPQEELDLAREFLSPKEILKLDKIPELQKKDAFLNAWTRKEAYLKAVGKGIDESLSEIEVTMEPGEPPRYISLYGDTQEASHWFLQSIQPGVGYIGSIACRQRGLRLASWHWPEDDLAYFTKRHISAPSYR